MKTIAFIALAAMTACSNRGMYEALRQNECLKNEHIIHCEDGRNYDQYMREREKVLNEDRPEKERKKSAKAHEDLPNLLH